MDISACGFSAPTPLLRSGRALNDGARRLAERDLVVPDSWREESVRARRQRVAQRRVQDMDAATDCHNARRPPEPVLGRTPPDPPGWTIGTSPVQTRPFKANRFRGFDDNPLQIQKTPFFVCRLGDVFDAAQDQTKAVLCAFDRSGAPDAFGDVVYVPRRIVSAGGRFEAFIPEHVQATRRGGYRIRTRRFRRRITRRSASFQRRSVRLRSSRTLPSS